ncbi:siderophore-interacting protein [Leucobacter albus]|uniref:Siderophore-interacting protein n=1 Tax=Leucobacter albus TaxID=272210 RepID=A0ABW3TPV9_9MICO
MQAPIKRTDRRPSTARDVIVVAREYVSENMIRLTLAGHDLIATVHDSPGSWVKLFVDEPDGFGEHGRAYTVRGFDPVADEITLDIFLHGAGTIPTWATRCSIGARARVAGPRASGAPSRATQSLALFGDETSLPAIAAILEREHSGRRAHAYIEVADERDEQDLSLPDNASTTWLTRRRGEQPGAQLLAAAKRTAFSDSMGVWFAGEAAAAHWFRHALPASRVAELHVRGYWRSGVGDYRE